LFLLILILGFCYDNEASFRWDNVATALVNMLTSNITNYSLLLVQNCYMFRFFSQTIIRHINTGCVSKSGDFKKVMNSKCFHLFSFNTYEHNLYIHKNLDFFIFNLSNLTI